MTLVVIHLVGINITGTSVNPARSIGPALIGIGSKPQAFLQLWLFIIAPLIGAGAAGLLFKETALFHFADCAWTPGGGLRSSISRAGTPASAASARRVSIHCNPRAP